MNPNGYPLPFFKRLQRQRGKRTQAQVATLLGVPLRTYQNWEQGRNSPPVWALANIIQRIR